MRGKRTRNAAEPSNKITSRNSKKRKTQSSEDMGCIESKSEGGATTSKGNGKKAKKVTPAPPQDKYQPCSKCPSLEKTVSDLQDEVQKHKRESRRLIDDGDERNKDLKSQLDSALHQVEELKSAKEQIEKEKTTAAKANDERYAKTCNKIEDLTNKLERAETKLREKHNELQAVSEKAKEKVRILTDDLRKLKAENERLLNRVSELAGAKLSAGNPNLVDISDENRPTKLAERYSELYDNDWTDAFTVLIDSGYDDPKVVEILLKLLITIFNECKSYADEDLESFNRNIVKSFRYDENSAEAMVLKKQYTDRRKKIYRGLKSAVKPKIDAKLRHILPETDRNGVQKFTEEAFDICMLMCVQDPHVVIGNVIDNPDSTFDATKYKAYTKSGKRIAYFVWPPLYLHQDGPILAKGIAQGQQDSLKKKRAPSKIPVAANDGTETQAIVQKQENSGTSKQETTKPLAPGQKDLSKSQQSKGASTNEPARNAGQVAGTDKQTTSEKSKRETNKGLKSVINVSVQGIQHQSSAKSPNRPISDTGRKAQLTIATAETEMRHSVPSRKNNPEYTKSAYI